MCGKPGHGRHSFWTSQANGKGHTKKQNGNSKGGSKGKGGKGSKGKGSKAGL